MREEPEQPEPVVDRDEHASPFRECVAVVEQGSDPLPSVWSPPWIHTITGSPSAPAGARTFSVRQSSLCLPGATFRARVSALRRAAPRPRPRTRLSKNSSIPAPRWNAVGPNFLHERTLRHGSGGAGGFQRRSPTGGAAYGMPRNTAIVPSSSSAPRTRPAVVVASTRVRFTLIAMAHGGAMCRPGASAARRADFRGRRGSCRRWRSPRCGGGRRRSARTGSASRSPVEAGRCRTTAGLRR